jgi:hypothetical protein
MLCVLKKSTYPKSIKEAKTRRLPEKIMNESCQKNRMFF